MRAFAFQSASEAPRLFSEVLAERRHADPVLRARDRVMAEIADLEAAAAAESDPAESKRLQCDAEALRVSLSEQP